MPLPSAAAAGVVQPTSPVIAAAETNASNFRLAVAPPAERGGVTPTTAETCRIIGTSDRGHAAPDNPARNARPSLQTYRLTETVHLGINSRDFRFTSAGVASG